MNTIVSAESNWQPCLDDKFLKCISVHDRQNAQRWKNHENQVVLKTADCYYKIYQLPDDGAPTFLSTVRDVFGKVYREHLGLHWTVDKVVTSRGVYQVEQRESLHVCESSEEFSRIFRSYASILTLVEKELQLDQLTMQLKKHIPRLHSIRLIRSAYNKHDDYAYDQNGQVVLLDDSDFFLAMLDVEGNWISEKIGFYEVDVLGQKCTFCPHNWDRIIKDHNNMTTLIEHYNRWTLVYGTIDQANVFNTIKNKLMSFKESMLQQNLLFLSGESDVVIDYDAFVSKQIEYEKP